MLTTKGNCSKYYYYKDLNYEERESELYLTILLKSPSADGLEVGCINSLKIPFTQIPLQSNSSWVGLHTYLVLKENLWSEPDHRFYSTPFSISIGFSPHQVKYLHSVYGSSKPIEINTKAYFSYLEWVTYNIYGLNKVEYNNLYGEKNFTAVPPSFSSIVDEFKFILQIYKTPLVTESSKSVISIAYKNCDYDQVISIDNCLVFFSITLDPINKCLVSKVFWEWDNCEGKFNFIELQQILNERIYSFMSQDIQKLWQESDYYEDKLPMSFSYYKEFNYEGLRSYCTLENNINARRYLYSLLTIDLVYTSDLDIQTFLSSVYLYG